jgi:hypothetical protein
VNSGRVAIKNKLYTLTLTWRQKISNCSVPPISNVQMHAIKSSNALYLEYEADFLAYAGQKKWEGGHEKKTVAC